MQKRYLIRQKDVVPIRMQKNPMYAFVTRSVGLCKNAKELRLRLVKRVLDKDEINDRFEDHYNSLVIAARKKLKPSDFEDSEASWPILQKREKAKASNSLQWLTLWF
jgi:hypothetical protein